MEAYVVSIIILNWNGLSVLSPCLEALERNTRHQPYEVILLDNGSTEQGIEEIAAKYPKVKVLRSPVNWGFAKGNNLAARDARGEYLVFLNNDTLPQPGWLEALVRMATEHQNCGLVGSRLMNPDGSIQHIGGYFVPEVRTFMSPYRGYPTDAPGVLVPRECEVYIACCLLVRRDAFDRGGGFDERFQQGFEDFDLCLTIREQGSTLWYCPESVVTHFAETSTKKLDIRTRRRNKRENTRYFYQKWEDKLFRLRLPPENIPASMTGFNYYTKNRSDVFEFFPVRVGKVLEVGCGAGILGEQLKAQGKAGYVCGVEINPMAAAMAKKRLDLVIVADVENSELSLEPESFDALLFADVLEHLRDPWRALLRLVKLLKPGGHVVASIPNIRHYKILRKLWRDHWRYEKEGILDRTHLRFFGLAAIRDLMNFSGLEILQVARRRRAKPWVLAVNRHWAVLDDLLTYQYLIHARKRSWTVEEDLPEGDALQRGGGSR